MKLCKDCKWCGNVFPGTEGWPAALCRYPGTLIGLSVITGEEVRTKKYTSCTALRKPPMQGEEEHVCGPAAAWFEPRENSPIS